MSPDSRASIRRVVPQVGQGTPGDISGDGDVNAFDVQLVINDALGISTGMDSDINNDGDVDALDVQLVINAALDIPILVK